MFDDFFTSMGSSSKWCNSIKLIQTISAIAPPLSMVNSPWKVDQSQDLPSRSARSDMNLLRGATRSVSDLVPTV